MAALFIMFWSVPSLSRLFLLPYVLSNSLHFGVSICHRHYPCRSLLATLLLLSFVAFIR